MIFDMDGTLIETNGLVMDLFTNLLEVHPSKVKIKSMDTHTLENKHYEEILRILYPDYNQTHLDALFQIHERIIHKHLKLRPNLLQTLESLREMGLKLYCLTNKNRKIAVNQLAGLCIYHLFDGIITLEDVERPKPDPEGLYKLMLEKKYSKHEMLFVGSGMNDGICGKEATIKTVYMNHDKDDSKTIYFNDVLESFDKLIEYVKDYMPAGRINITKKAYITMLQLTDLSLGNPVNDAKTKRLLTRIIHNEKPDLIVLTGDQVAQETSLLRYQALIVCMEAFKTPWTFVFGDHEYQNLSDFNAFEQLLKTAKYLIFKKGSSSMGLFNFFIEIRSERKTNGLLFFMDSHIKDVYLIEKQLKTGVGSIKENQLKWYDKVVNQYHFDYEKIPSNLIFSHIPPYEFSEVLKENKDSYQGLYLMTPNTPPIKSKLIEYLKKQRALGFFVGHDCYNDFQFYNEGVLFGYGRTTGYKANDTHEIKRGGRVIKLQKSGVLSTYITNT